jgi:hypothetical protein
MCNSPGIPGVRVTAAPNGPERRHAGQNMLLPPFMLPFEHIELVKKLGHFQHHVLPLTRILELEEAGLLCCKEFCSDVVLCFSLRKALLLFE